MHDTGRAHREMLRRVTRHLATTQDLHTVLASITSGLVEHTGMLFSHIWLYQHHAECERCRLREPRRTPGERALHLAASAGAISHADEAIHYLPLHLAVPPAMVARERIPYRSQEMLQDVTPATPPALVELLRSVGGRGGAAYPLVFRDELLGAIGMVSGSPLDDEEFELMGIFADQAAMAIKSAQLFQELERYRDRLQDENAYLQEEIAVERGFEGIVGESPALRAVLRKVKQVAPVETTVLLTGETGTGKELIARALHHGSPRHDRPLIKVNCGAIPQGVVESELFGHEKGAFTGALQRRIGRFELADKGSLFMDEVGELPLDTQVKLLRVLQEQEFERVGSTRLQTVDVRLIAATNRDLETEVAENRFRADLFYRLNVFPIRVPPLRERPSDIPLLVSHFLAQFQRKLAKPLRSVSPDGIERLQRYAWPGNIRELQNVIERACVLSQGPVVEIIDELRAPDGNGASSPQPVAPAAAGILSLEEQERLHIRRALAATGGRVHGPDGAAVLLGINPSTLRSRMKKLGITKPTA
ncbi:MAG TPA: sigma 54-interacting transcriptional regulator [Gemmatimonadales bacterium]|nr:sigma 54-interacting transcriptional regulator [Gemmatimonadales bacterium]